MDHGLLNSVPEDASNAGLDPADPRFVELATLVEKGEYGSAAQACEALLRQGILDVRVIGYYGYGVFLEGGVGALGPLADVLARLFATRLGALGPSTNKLKHARTSMGWLMKHLTRKLERELSTKGEDPLPWVKASSEEVAAARSGVTRLASAMGEVLGEGGGLKEQAAKLDLLLGRFEEATKTEPVPGPATVEVAEVEPSPRKKATAEPRPEAGVPIAGSRALHELRQKLGSFEELLAAGKLAQARIVADDVQAVLEHFDPCLYFPEIFAGFLRLSAARADDLAAAEQDRETPRFKALAAYYRADPEGFKSL